MKTTLTLFITLIMAAPIAVNADDAPKPAAQLQQGLHVDADGTLLPLELRRGFDVIVEATCQWS